MTDLVLTPLHPEHHDDCARILTDAFIDDPFMSIYLHRGQDRLQRLHTYYRALFASPAAERRTIDVALRAEGRAVLGLAVWEAPGTKYSPLDARHTLVPTLRLVDPRRVREALRSRKVLGTSRPTTEHWHLGDIAVDPRAAGQGVGSALLRHGLARADEASLPTHLEATSSDAARLYRRFGFEDTELLGLTEDGYPLGMVRPAQ